jgi:hypothetical protein
LGFRGITIGSDYDTGYSDLVRTGFYGILNVLLTDSARLDLRTAFDWEKARINLGEPYTRGAIDESALFSWAAGRLSGNLFAHIGMDSSHLTDTQYLRAGASAGTHVTMLKAGGLTWGLGLDGGFEHDAFQELFGMPATAFRGMLSMDVGYVPVGAETERRGW